MKSSRFSDFMHEIQSECTMDEVISFEENEQDNIQAIIWDED